MIQLCVVGAGPRGVSVVERLCAALSTQDGPAVVLHIVDPSGSGGGQVWRTTQSRVLLMNTVASQVTMFTDDTVDCVGPLVPGPSLYEWARLITDAAGVFDEYPAEVLVELRALGPNSYPSRALYGEYVGWVLRSVIDSVPDHVSVVFHRAVATALDDAADGTQTLTLDSGRRLAGLNAVVLAQGHVDVELTEQEAELRRFAVAGGLEYVPPGNPADSDLGRIRPAQPVALRGMGLNFFDHLALLTIGRGGSFHRDGTRLSYRASGAEPVLYAGSRRGIPYHARGENQKGSSGRHEPFFLTESVVRALRTRVEAGWPLSFRRDIWPLVSREVRAVYYHALLAGRDGQEIAESFLKEFVVGGEHTELALLDAFGIPPAQRWDWRRITDPWGDRTFAGHQDYQDWLLEHLRADVAEASRGNVDGPLKAALDVLRDLRNEIRLVVDHGGLTARSYREELQGWYNPLNGLVSIGPPVSRIEEMIALIEAGVLTVLGPRMTVSPAPDGRAFVVGSAAVPGPDIEVTALIEARLPEVDLARTTDPLMRYLNATGQCRGYRIACPDRGIPYETGGLAVTTRPYHLVDAAGRPHPARFAFGVPTETVHWVTAAGIRPGVNSVILGDSDAIAQSALTVAGVRPAPRPA